ncbi:cache domain-containing protein [uncultured Methanospirillum sp.]|uniref:cache domain-containing protein n=1 Tax=uncultured Methanospirillum sp. TaxID=262503 RepID=UPI0029C669C5|nr:cache domain-containing protein [uncultured Methanospirillum sp.]
MKLSGFAFLSVLTMMLFFSCVSAQSSDTTGSFEFTGTVVHQDLEGGFFGIITDTGDTLLPTNLPGQYEVDGLRISGTATPQTDMVSANMWGTLVSVEDVSPLNGGGKDELAWYQAVSTEKTAPDDQIFRVLGRVAADLQKRLDTIDGQLADVAANMSGKEYSKENQTILLSSLVESTAGNQTGVYESSILDKSGHIIAVYPDAYMPSIGTDLSRQPHIARVLSYPAPGMSTYLKTIEGKDAVIITYPVLSKQKAVTSYVSSLVSPSVLISPDTMEYLKESGYSLMVEQPEGTILSESESDQVGRSAWNDPEFNASPSLLKTAVHLQNARAGYDTYSGLKNQEVQVAWTTVTLHGIPWRVAVMNP